MKLCSLAARDAHNTGNRRITSRNFESILGTYSHDRIQDTFSEFRFSSQVKATARDLHQFMYKINFLIAVHKSSTGKVSRYYFEENRFFSNDSVDFGNTWEIHPAYRSALRGVREMRPKARQA